MTPHPNTHINWPPLPEHDVEEWSESGITLRYVGWSEEKVLAYAESVCTEQATEIAELKAKLAEVMPLAKFGAMVSDSGHYRYFLAIKSGIFKNGTTPANIEATIERILKD